MCPCRDGSPPEDGWCGVRGGGTVRRGRYPRVHVWGRQIPIYSYVYTYENKTLPNDNITYPEYNISTTIWNDDHYKEAEDWTCPCDLTEFTTGEQDINLLVETVAKSVAEQQKKADYDFYEPLLADPSSVPEVGESTTSFFEEQDDEGLDFYDKEGI